MVRGTRARRPTACRSGARAGVALKMLACGAGRMLTPTPAEQVRQLSIKSRRELIWRAGAQLRKLSNASGVWNEL